MKKIILSSSVVIMCMGLLLTGCKNTTGLTGTGVEIPAIDTERLELPENEAMTFAENLKIGWNLGNTLDNTRFVQDESISETAWGSPQITEEMILAVKNAGFNTIRIPVTWHNHMDENYKISDYWLGRVKEIVDYAYNNGMYVIINIHHDTDKAYFYPTYETLDSSLEFIEAVWTQLCEIFKEYDERLIFESINEPRLIGTDFEWWIDTNTETGKEAIDCVMQANQTFVDLVRASGGNNSTRYLMTPSYCASYRYACDDLFSLPDDPANRTIVSIHAYEPQNFALDDNINNNNFIIGRSSRSVDAIMDMIYEKFTSKGVPAVIGEFGARDKDNLEARINYAAYYVASARSRGITCLWWDNHAFEGSGELFGLLDRDTLEWTYPDIVIAMVNNCE